MTRSHLHIPGALLLLAALAGAACAAPKDSDAFGGVKAYCYFDAGKHTWRIGNDAVERTVQFDMTAGSLRTTRLAAKRAGARVAPVAPEGELDIAGAPTVGDKTLSLAGDWVYIWQTVATPASHGRLLTIHLQGRGRNAGYELEALYEVYPGNRPYETMALTLINRTGQPVTVKAVRYAGWTLEAAPGRKRAAPVVRASGTRPVSAPAGTIAGGLVADTTNRVGVAAGIVSGVGKVTRAAQTLSLSAAVAAPIADGAGGRYYAPTAMVIPFAGDAVEGAALLRRYPEAIQTAAER